MTSYDFICNFSKPKEKLSYPDRLPRLAPKRLQHPLLNNAEDEADDSYEESDDENDDDSDGHTDNVHKMCLCRCLFCLEVFPLSKIRLV